MDLLYLLAFRCLDVQIWRSSLLFTLMILLLLLQFSETQGTCTGVWSVMCCADFYRDLCWKFQQFIQVLLFNILTEYTYHSVIVTIMECLHGNTVSIHLLQ